MAMRAHDGGIGMMGGGSHNEGDMEFPWKVRGRIWGFEGII
jgi:hypothetical protein